MTAPFKPVTSYPRYDNIDTRVAYPGAFIFHIQRERVVTLLF